MLYSYKNIKVFMVKSKGFILAIIDVIIRWNKVRTTTATTITTKDTIVITIKYFVDYKYLTACSCQSNFDLGMVVKIILKLVLLVFGKSQLVFNLKYLFVLIVIIVITVSVNVAI